MSKSNVKEKIVNSMKRRIIIVIILLLIVGGVLAYFYYIESKKNTHELILYGNVDVRQVDIGFRVPGQVDELFFEEGDVVKKGDLMAVLDITPYNSQVNQAEANVINIKVNLENAQTLLKRRQELIGNGGISLEDLQNTQTSRDQLTASLNSAQAALDIALDNLKYTKAYAPTEGIILSRIREPGTVVRESDPVYSLSVSNPVWIRAFVDEIHLGQVQYGMEAEVFTDNPQGHSYKGRIGFISPLAEFTPKTVETTKLRTDLVYRLRVYVDNPDGGLRQGMPVTVKLNLNDREKKSE